jgi:hypothetical protein
MHRNGNWDEWFERALENIAYAGTVAARRFGEEAAQRASIAAFRYVHRGGPLARNFTDRAEAVRLVCWRARRQLWTMHQKAQRERLSPPDEVERTVAEPNRDWLGMPTVDGEAAVDALWRSIARHFLAARGKLDKPELKLACWRLRYDGYSTKEIATKLTQNGYLAGETSVEDENTVRQWFSRTAPRMRAALEAARAELGLDD